MIRNSGSPEAAWAPPARLIRVEEARRRFGGFVDRLAPALLRADPLADRAVEALAPLGGAAAHEALSQALRGDTDVPREVSDLLDAASELPVWTDERRLARAGRLLFRTGIPGGIALGAKSLLSGYCSPAGNKPLMWSGRLQSGVSRRLAETAKFVVAVAEPGGLLPGAEGFAITLRVRLIHAQVRLLIREKGGWRADLWGAPINQHDMAATILLFAHAWLDGVEALGIHLTSEEAEDYVHLWRVAGHVLGVEHDLLPATRAEGDRLAEIMHITQERPDDDARRLVKAFLQHPQDAATSERERRAVARRMQAYAGMIRYLLGEETANDLALPRDRWRFAAPALREVVRRAERIRRTVPRGDRLAVQAGRQHWDNVVRLGLMGIPAEFELPQKLAA
jgi:hypothetical protein